MSYIPLPNKEGWYVEAKTVSGKEYSRWYLKSNLQDKESAKKPFLLDTSVTEEFEKITVSEAII